MLFFLFALWSCGADLLIFKPHLENGPVESRYNAGIRASIAAATCVKTESTWTHFHAHNLFFHQIDFLISKPLPLQKQLLVEPKVGISLIKIKHKFVPNSCRFEAVGTKAGFDSRWGFFPCLNLFGGFYGTLYYGRFDHHQQELSELLHINNHDRFEDVRFGSTLFLGLEYLLSLPVGKLCRLAVSWEANWFPNQNLQNGGDFSLSGAVLSATVYF